MLIILNPNASKLCLKQIENGRVRLIQNLDKQKSFLKNDRVYLENKNKRAKGVRSPPNPWFLRICKYMLNLYMYLHLHFLPKQDCTTA